MDLSQLVGGIILSVGYIPQIGRILRTKSVGDFSLKTLLMVSIGIGFMEIYATYNFMLGQAVMFFVTNTISFLISVAMVVLYLRYRRS